MGTQRLVNPWSEVPSQAPFVLPQDKPYVDICNALLGEDTERKESKIAGATSKSSAVSPRHFETRLPPSLSWVFTMPPSWC